MMTPLARPQNDNRLTVDFRIRQHGRRYLVERRTQGGDSLAFEGLWHEVRTSPNRQDVENFCRLAAARHRSKGALVRVTGLPATSHADHEAGFHSSAR